MKVETTLRVARPTDRLDDVVRFYVDGLGLTLLDSFENHDGVDGAMVGLPGAPYHLEFTQTRGHVAGGVPTPDHLLVFYIPDSASWRSVADRMLAAGHAPVPSLNPYWDRAGQTFEDPDGYRVVLQRESWPG